jgi:hypothetical protein
MRAKPSQGAPSGRMVQVFATSSIPNGALMRGLLESEGIPVIVKGESEGPYRLGSVHLLVPEEFEIQARMLVEDAESGRLAGEAEEPSEE